MPTIGEILTDIDKARYPNPFTEAQKLVWAKEILKKIYKFTNDYSKTTIKTVANQATYSLTLPVLFENILELKVGGSEYKYQPVFGEPTGSYYYNADSGKVGIYPIPTESDVDIEIFYIPTFTTLTTSSVPIIKEDYHSLITNYICMTAASSGQNPDTEMANIFAIRFNEDWDRFITDWAKTKVNHPKKRKCNRWW